MAFLKHRSLDQVAIRLLLLGFGLAVASCTLMSVFSPGGPSFGFSHARHAQEGLECGDCHMFWEDEDAPGMPVRAACDLCHEEIDAEKPPDKRIDALFNGDEYRAQHVTALDDEVIFSHKQHATAQLATGQLECKACHADVLTNEFVDDRLALGMKDCQLCHAQQAAPNECATCHQDLRIDRAPSTHDFQWQKVHGNMVRAHSTETANDCSMCHDESTCNTCHRSEQPDNHNNYFRLRGHGLHARMDRQNCAVCHRTESCEECHRITRPVNHFGSFGGTQSTHCVGCHLPIQRSECFACHKSAPSHDLATPKPPDHSPGMNCRLCHGAGQALPHVDNGSDCNACHH